MNFVSLLFWAILFLSVPLALTSRWLVRRIAPALVPAHDRLALAGMSLLMLYGAGTVTFVIFVTEVAFVYGGMQLIVRLPRRLQPGLAALVVGLALVPLLYYKYAQFLLGDVLGLEVSRAAVSIPAGISFYTFQLIAFAIDTLTRHQRMPSPLAFLDFIAFFPQIVAGPIERRRDLLPQIRRFRAYVVWFTTILFGLRIYFDFAGYSLIAVGLGRAFNVRLTYNFLAPYVSRNVREFWRRWHVTLSGWFRDYVYLPLGGGRVPWAVANILVVFGVSGLWHGAGFNFVLWGLLHGLLLVGYRAVGGRIPMADALAWAITCMLVTFTWLFFYETDGAALAAKLQHLMQPAGYGSDALAAAVGRFTLRDWWIVGTTLALVAAVLLVEQTARARPLPYRPFLRLPVTIVLVLLTVPLAATETTRFIYFAF